MILIYLIVVLSYCSFAENVEMEIGNAIDLFKNYGLLMCIFPVNEFHNEFMKDEFSLNVFDKLSLSKSMIETSIPYDSGLWNIKVYKDVLHILDDMLVDFKIEYIKDVRNVFTMFWPMSSLAEFIGLPHTHFAKHYSFLVVKNQRCIKHFRLHNTPPDNTVLDEKLKNAVQNITYQNGASVFNFVSHFGSHYVRSFSVGAVLYQVFAFPTKAYLCVKTLTSEFTLEYLYKCVNKSSIHAGQIKILSNSEEPEERLDSMKNDEIKSLFGKRNIFYFWQNENLLFDFCKEENLAVTGFKLSSISNLVRDQERTITMQEVIDNQMKLRETFL